MSRFDSYSIMEISEGESEKYERNLSECVCGVHEIVFLNITRLWQQRLLFSLINLEQVVLRDNRAKALEVIQNISIHTVSTNYLEIQGTFDMIMMVIMHICHSLGILPLNIDFW